MRHTKLLIVILVFLFSFAANAKQFDAKYDHGKRQWNCNGTPAAGDCLLQVNELDTVSVSIVNTIPGLFSWDIQQDLKPVVGVSNSILKLFGIPVPQAPAGANNAARIAAMEILLAPPPDDAYENLLIATDELRSALLGDFTDYALRFRYLTNARVQLLRALAPAATSTAAEVLAALKARRVSILMTDAQFTAYWTELDDLIATAAVAPTNGPSKSFTYDDRDFDVNVLIKPVNDLVQNPPLETRSVVQLKNAWRISTTTGLAVSGLRDDHYTTRTETTGSGTTAVTKKIAVREDRDQVSVPEATLFVNLYPPACNWAFSAGMGVATNASGRIYLGASYRLGRAGALTFGVAGGKVKRLSKNVNVDDLGTVDPEASRRDVYRGSFMLGFSWSLTGK